MSPTHRRPSTESLASLSSLPPGLTHSQSEYPFPRYDSASRNNSISRYNPRRGSTASSISSIGGTLDTSSGAWSETVREAGHNAISTLLQPPIVRSGLIPHLHPPTSAAHRMPTARDIPPVTLTNIPHVEPSSFKPYLHQVGKLYDALQRAKDAEDEEESDRELVRKNSRSEFPDLLGQGQNTHGRPSVSRKASWASLSSLNTLEAPGLARRRSSGGLGKRAPQGPAPLSTIPSVYFDDNFHLENPRTFNVVSERSDVVRPVEGGPQDRRDSAGPRKALATNAILQEKLSWYMDTIEVHLISAISTASSSFFAALGSLRELHSEAAESVARIKQLRQELEALDKEMALGGLDIVNKRRRRENLKKLGDAVLQLRSIVDAVRKCEAYVDEGEVERALDAMEALESLIHGEQDEADAKTLGSAKQENLVDLSTAVALKGVDNDLSTLRLRIGKTFEARFIRELLTDLRQHIETTSRVDALKRWSSYSARARGGHSREKSAFPSYLTTNDQFRAELLSNLAGLYRSNYTSPATSAYKDTVLREIKHIIKQPLPSSNDDDTDSVMSMATVGGNKPRTQQDRSMALARNLRALDPADAEEMLVRVYIGVGEALRRLGTQVKVLLDVTTTLDGSTPGSPPPSSHGRSPAASPTRGSPQLGSINDRMSNQQLQDHSSRQIQEELHQALDMSNLLGQAVDIAQNQIVKVLRVRNQQSVEQNATRFLRYFTLNLLFANECEAVSGRSGTVLKTLVNNQIKEFLQQLSNTQQRELAKSMDGDNWSAKDFSEEDEKVLKRVLDGSDKAPEAWERGSKIWLPYSEIGPTTTSANGEVTSPNAKKETRPATIEEENFLLPSSAIACLNGLEPYMELITVIPSLSPDISTLLVSYLQLFNSRATQLILGAGATRIAGLKHITAKHLALASRALSFVSTLIPYIREFVRRHIGAGPQLTSLMGEFDKVRRAYQEHQSSISDKLIDIMSGRVAICIRAMTSIQWDEASDKALSPYMETLTKETGTLHRVLSKHLPDSTVLGIMEPVLKSYREQLGEAFQKATVTTEAGKERMIRDAEHFATKMSKIEGSGELGEYIANLVKSKLLPEKEAPPAPGKEEEKKEEPQAGVMFEAADPTTPVEPSGSTSIAPDEQQKKTESAAEKTEATGLSTIVASTDPSLPPTPEQLEAEKKRKQDESGESSPRTASEEAKLNGIEEVAEAIRKELPPTPMEVDERDKKMGERSG